MTAVLEDVPPRRPRTVVAFVVAVAAAGVLVPVSVTGELASFLVAAASIAPFAALGLLAQYGVERPWARAAARVLAVLILFGMFGVDLLVVFGALAEHATDGPPRLPPGAGAPLAHAAVGGVAALAVSLATWRFSGSSDERSEPRRLALTVVVGLTALCVVPLLVLGEPPLLLWFQRELATGVDPLGGRTSAGLLRDQLYSLCCTVPAAFVAVGYGVRRNAAETVQRLGLARPSRSHWRIAATLTVALLGATWAWEHAIAAVWSAFGWPQTDVATFEALFEFALSPQGAVVIAVVAGIGEELSVRGVLQPSIGIFRSNLLFTALHALQYGWDALLSVFLVGLVLGVTRRRTSTTVTALIHGGYDFVVVMTAVVARWWT